MKTAPRRAKTATAAGLLTMLLGAMLVLAPHAAADEDDGQNGNLAGECRTALGLPAGAFVYAGKWEQGEITGNFEHPTETIGGFSAETDLRVTVDSDPTELLIEFENASPGVQKLVVSQAGTETVEGTYDYASEGEATFPGDNIDDDVSHITLCGAPAAEEDPGFLVIEKDVTGPVPEGDFTFSVNGDTYDLGDGEDTDPIELPIGDYTVTETEDQDAETTSVSCTDGAADDDTSAEGVTISEGATTRCTFTNTFLEVIDDQTATLTIVKTVDEDAPADWAFDFDGELGEFTLSDEVSEESDSTLTPDDYTVNEVAGVVGDEWTVGSVSCDDGTVGTVAADNESASVTVTLEDGDDVRCTFANVYTEVDDSTTPNNPTVNPTVTPAAKTPTAPAAAVQGSVTPRVLAATGSGTDALSVVGIGLLVFGAVLTLGSRRRMRVLA